jgi:ribosome-binding factor A
MSDPRFHLVTITSAVVSPDLRSAKIYWMATGGKERIDEVQDAFASASGLLRTTMAKELGLKIAPDLKFFYDDTLDVQEQTYALLERIKA